MIRNRDTNKSNATFEKEVVTLRKRTTATAPWMEKLRRYIDKHSGSNKAFAEQIGISPGYLSGLLQGNVPPSRRIVLLICKASGGKITPGDILNVYSRETA